jgi:arginyl-tRNA synthetase
MLLTNYQHRYAALLSTHVGLSEHAVLELLTTPPQANLGDLAFPVFTLAKEQKIAPPVLASQIVEKIEQAGLPHGFTRIIAAGPYVNIFVDMAHYVAEVLSPEGEKHHDTRNVGQ